MSSDLALRNCLLTADLTVKIGDYGLSHCKYKVSVFGGRELGWGGGHGVRALAIGRIWRGLERFTIKAALFPGMVERGYGEGGEMGKRQITPSYIRS